MPTTYEPIASTTLGSAANSVTFGNIAATWTDIIVACSYRDTRAQKYGYLRVRFNNDSGSNYSVTRVYGTGGSAGSSRQSSQAALNLMEGAGASSPTDEFAPGVFHVMNYANTNVFKTTLAGSGNVSGDGGFNVLRTVGLWRSTDAITRIDILPDVVAGSQLASGSTFSLYGIKAA